MSSASEPAGRRRALLSVSDRTGLVELAGALVETGFEILSTGGTSAHLASAGIPVRSISEETGFPEVFGGRVKTLQPKLFGGILYDRSREEDRRQAAELGILPIEIVAVNLYPFEETLERTGLAGPEDPAVFAELIEKIDVGGPSLLRASAKNHAHVAVLCDPADYPGAIAELRETGGIGAATRRRLASKVFRRTAAYDAAIARWLTESVDREPFPERLSLPYVRSSTLRYGENPHQKGAFFVDPGAPSSSFARFVSIQGKELSYNNLLDADAALVTSRAVGPGALTIVKHRIPSGIARGSAAAAFEKAWASDPVAGFGGVVAYTGTLDAAGAEALVSRFLEVVVAEGVADDARPALARKPNLRVLTVAPARGAASGPELGTNAALQFRGVDGGLLVQEGDTLEDDESAWKTVTSRAPTDLEARALSFAWRAVRGVVSNAIVVAGADATFGIGGGRTSRVDACRDAVAKAGERARGSVAASDAFFPFPDGVEVLADAGVTAIAQPGGSVRDADVIAAADALGIAMVFTGKRHFRH